MKKSKYRTFEVTATYEVVGVYTVQELLDHISAWDLHPQYGDFLSLHMVVDSKLCALPIYDRLGWLSSAPLTVEVTVVEKKGSAGRFVE